MSKPTIASVRCICCTMLATNLILLAIAFATAQGGHTLLSRLQGADNSLLGGDYVVYHNAGWLLNHYSAARLYDLQLQAQLFHDLFPRIAATKALYYVHPPFLAILLRPLATLPYAYSYLSWLVLSLGLYIAGLCLLRTIAPLPHWPIVLLLALSFQPFLLESWRGGQSSVVGFAALAVALYCWHHRCDYWAGVALGLCLYKPTLLVLLGPGLLLGRQWRVLVGFTSCGLVLGLMSWAMVGWSGCLDYYHVARIYSHAAATDSLWDPAKFVDLSSFLAVAHARSPLGLAVVAVVAVMILGWLAGPWWRVNQFTGLERTLLLANTCTFTMVVNLYAATYDTIVIVPSILITAALLRARHGLLPESFQRLLMLVYLVPYFTQVLAAVGLQPNTPLLILLGWYQLAVLHGRLGPQPGSEVNAAPRGATLDCGL